MILGASQDPTAQNPVPFSPPASARGTYMPQLPGVGFYSDNLQPFTQVTERVSTFPAYRPPLNPNAGPRALPPIASAAPAAPMAPAPGPTPAGTNGAFGGSGFGSSGGVRPHMHRPDPYQIMRSGNIPGVAPSGSNIRSGYLHAGNVVQHSMPFQQPHNYPVMIPSPPPPPMPMPGPMPSATHGLGSWWNPMTWFKPKAQMNGFGAWHHRSAHTRRMQPRVSAGYSSQPMSNCEWVGPRVDGMYVQICNGRVMAFRDQDGNVQAYPQSGDY
jgi:hypothetical protein